MAFTAARRLTCAKWCLLFLPHYKAVSALLSHPKISLELSLGTQSWTALSAYRLISDYTPNNLAKDFLTVNRIMTRTLIAAAGLTMITTGTSNAADASQGAHFATTMTTSMTNSTTPLMSGIDMHNADTAVRPQDDFYSYVNGTWLKKTEIPADKSSWGSFYELRENSLNQLRTIVDSVSKNKTVKVGSNEQKIADVYASFMDENTLDALGVAPLTTQFARIDALQNKKQIAGMIAHLSRIGVKVPYDIGIHQDARDSTKVIVDLGQSGLGLPDRDYYLKDDDAKLKETRIKYLAHIEKMLTLAGDKAPAQNAASILTLETALAKLQWTKVQNRDPVKTYNKVELSQLPTLAPHNDWNSYLAEAGLKPVAGRPPRKIPQAA